MAAPAARSLAWARQPAALPGSHLPVKTPGKHAPGKGLDGDDSLARPQVGALGQNHPQALLQRHGSPGPSQQPGKPAGRAQNGAGADETHSPAPGQDKRQLAPRLSSAPAHCRSPRAAFPAHLRASMPRAWLCRQTAAARARRKRLRASQPRRCLCSRRPAALSCRQRSSSSRATWPARKNTLLFPHRYLLGSCAQGGRG